MEGQDVTFTVVLSNEAEITVTVDFTTADITAQGMKFIVSDTQLRIISFQCRVDHYDPDSIKSKASQSENQKLLIYCQQKLGEKLAI